MNETLFRRLKMIQDELSTRTVKKLYLFPFGFRAMEVCDFFAQRYTYELIKVDNGLCKYNPDILPFYVMRKQIQQECGSMMLLTSDCPEIYTELRVLVKRYIPTEKYLDVFPVHPLFSDSDKLVSGMAHAAEEIYKRAVRGNVAQAGLWKGNAYRYINILFPDRMFHIFESYDRTDFFRQEVRQGWSHLLDAETIRASRKMKESIVMQSIQHPHTVVFHRNLFPKVECRIKETYAFVCMDMDLYSPTYDGLQYFWNNMNPGGIIFIRHFNTCAAIERAVLRFCEETEVGYHLLGDVDTAVLSKPPKRNVGWGKNAMLRRFL